MKSILHLSIFFCLLIISCKKDPPAITEKYKVYKLGIIAEEITSINIDNANNIWLSTAYSGFYKLNGKEWINYGQEELGFTVSRINNIEIDSKNNLWAGTNNGLIHYDGTKWINYFSNSTPNIKSVVSSVYVDKFDNVWFVRDDSLWKYNGYSWNGHLFNFPATQVQKITSDNYDNIWIGSYGSLFKFDGNYISEIPNPVSDSSGMFIKDLKFQPDNSAWICTLKGLYYFKNESFTPIDTVEFKEPLFEYWLSTSVEISSEQVTWIGTWNSGLAKYANNRFEFMRGSEFNIDTTDFQINHLKYDHNENLWIVTRFNDVIVFNEKGIKRSNN